MRIDYINGLEEFDGSLWYFDGQYVGHDDQIEAIDFTPENTVKIIEFHHRTIRSGVEYVDLPDARHLDEIEPFLNEEKS